MVRYVLIKSKNILYSLCLHNSQQVQLELEVEDSYRLRVRAQ